MTRGSDLLRRIGAGGHDLSVGNTADRIERNRMQRIKKWVAAHSVLTTIVLMLAITGSAFAAWIVWSGAQGSGGAQVGSATINNALVLTPNWQNISDAKLVPGASDGDVEASIQNLGPNATKLLTLAAGTITASPSCNTAGINFTPDPANVGAGSNPIPGGGSVSHIHIGTLSASASLDPTCANSSLSIAFTGTTQP